MYHPIYEGINALNKEQRATVQAYLDDGLELGFIRQNHPSILQLEVCFVNKNFVLPYDERVTITITGKGEIL